MLRHNYVPKVKAKPSDDDYRAEIERYKQLDNSLEVLKSEYKKRSAAIRRELLAKKAWLARYQTSGQKAHKESTDVLDATYQAALDESIKSLFG